MGRLLLVFLTACASAAPEPRPAPPPSRPHIAELAGSRLGCPKTQTALPLESGWSALANDGGAMVLGRGPDCRAVLVARAGRKVNEGEDFAVSWALAERTMDGVSWFAESGIEPRAIAEERFAQIDSGIRIAYERDQLASLTCSFLLVAEATCPDDAFFAALVRAPAALRAPVGPAVEPPPRALPERFTNPERSQGDGRRTP